MSGQLKLCYKLLENLSKWSISRIIFGLSTLSATRRYILMAPWPRGHRIHHSTNRAIEITDVTQILTSVARFDTFGPGSWLRDNFKINWGDRQLKSPLWSERCFCSANSTSPGYHFRNWKYDGRDYTVTASRVSNYSIFSISKITLTYTENKKYEK